MTQHLVNTAPIPTLTIVFRLGSGNHVVSFQAEPTHLD